MAGRSAEGWYDALPEEWQPRALRVRELLLEASPRMHERLRYGVPFFDHRSWLAYLRLQKGRLVLAFLQGQELLDPEGLLARTPHKLIRQHFLPYPSHSLDEPALRRLIAEAVAVNEEQGRRKGRRRS
ncbi:MAG: DUF1801 domain-containing protein [Flavobacteriales bacterium]|nr:MAG: DUF1801 domain-containing protein [Flavobacteriales bacterium]